MGCENGEPVSVVSVSRDVVGNRAVISLLVAPERRRAGVARATMEIVRDAFPDVDEFVAYVDRANLPSAALMSSLRLAAVPYQDAEKTLFVWRRGGTLPPADWAPPEIPRY